MAAFLMLLRWLHFLFGITWIGLLYYLNFAQTPFFAETEAPVRSGAQQKLLPRVLWWFRWGAMGTVIFGAIYLIIWWSREGYGLNTWAIAILTGGTLGIIMWANVWLVIWPKQKVVIANAIATAGGFLDFAKVTGIYVLRPTPGGGQKRLAFNYKDVIKGKHPEQNIKLEPGDTVVVP